MHGAGLADNTRDTYIRRRLLHINNGAGNSGGVAMADNGPYGVKYPVAFHAGGDTTRDAFRKHIKEIEEIYAKLNALNDGKLDSTTLTTTIQEHIDDENPHPNYKPSFDAVTGNLEMSRVTGNLDGSRITGTINNATIPSEKVTGLKAFVEELLLEDKGDGITEGELSETGSIKFKNGLILKWGNCGALFSSGRGAEYKYPEAFPSECFCVSLTYKRHDSSDLDDTWVQLNGYDKEGFTCTRQADNAYTGGSSTASVNYIAIGK